MPSPAEGEVVVLDGGLATELEARGFDLSGRLWSAWLLLSDPGAIEDLQLDYFRAGARVATTASYQATVPGFAAAGLDRGAALEAIRTSWWLLRDGPERHRGTGRDVPLNDGLIRRLRTWPRRPVSLSRPPGDDR